jgi:hypothetical protein
MAVPTDVLLAKQALSGRLLQAGLQGNVLAAATTFRVDEVVASARRNVHAVGVGRKIVNGETIETASVRIYVTQKVAPSLLPPRDRLPETIDGIPTDVIESLPAFLASESPSEMSACTRDRRKRQRPVGAGISAAHRDVTAGTISCFCRSIRHGDDPSKVYVMSNNHVFANVNQSQIGDPLYQQGPADGGTADDHFANLHRFIPMKLGGTEPNRVDAAIGELSSDVEFEPEVCQIGKIMGIGEAVEDMDVCKHGRTTGYTEGTVTDESYDALIGMDHSDPNVVAFFENQVRIERTPPYLEIGLGGDSGSLVFSKTKAEAVGLYFANPPSGSYGVANHIADVLSELQIELL